MQSLLHNYLIRTAGFIFGLLVLFTACKTGNKFLYIIGISTLFFDAYTFYLTWKKDKKKEGDDEGGDYSLVFKNEMLHYLTKISALVTAIYILYFAWEQKPRLKLLSFYAFLIVVYDTISILNLATVTLNLPPIE